MVQVAAASATVPFHPRCAKVFSRRPDRDTAASPIPPTIRPFPPGLERPALPWPRKNPRHRRSPDPPRPLVGHIPDNVTVPCRQLLPAKLLDFAIMGFTRFSVPMLVVVVYGTVDVIEGGFRGVERWGVGRLTETMQHIVEDWQAYAVLRPADEQRAAWAGSGPVADEIDAAPVGVD
jgi:hypothetical protein